ncbi:hypothetical protein [Paenibacillus polymyxa]|uniref:hypothetical protein n=1 Tax=Paenibacillus polymyxa TaxID=1406 RepID=UPI0015615C3A|nr:hypothetical protein [Paenibacillus polymyxa]
MMRPLRERIVLPIAVAPGFLNWKTCKGWNPGAKANANASPERFRPLRCFQHQPVCGAELGKVRHIRCRTFPRAMEKQWNTLFYHKQRFWKDCRICTANSP